MLQKINDIKAFLNTKYKEREEIINALFIALIARQHVLLIGLPGTAKSALIADFVRHFEGSKYFQWLLTRFSTPEELFGAISLKELEKGVFKRHTADKLPEAQIAFLDEIFKSNSAILNALLTLINERIFYNDGKPVASPLQTVIGGSNEYPEDGEGLEALFDRFLLRFEVDYIGEDASFFNMLKSDTQFIKPVKKLTMDELDQLQGLSDMVDVPDEVLNVLTQIRADLKNEGIRPSDRRFRQSLSLLKASAVLDNRTEVELKDLRILAHGLWETVVQKGKVTEIVSDYSVDQLTNELDKIIKISEEVWESVKKNSSPENAVEATKKLQITVATLKTLESKYANRKDEVIRVQEVVKQAMEQITKVSIGL